MALIGEFKQNWWRRGSLFYIGLEMFLYVNIEIYEVINEYVYIVVAISVKWG